MSICLDGRHAKDKMLLKLLWKDIAVLRRNDFCKKWGDNNV